MMKVLSNVKALLLGVLGFLFAGAAMAQSAPAGPDFSTLTNAISFSTVVTAILAVGVLIVGLRLAVKGSKIVLRFINGA
jgi:hypothetical protein